MYQVTAEEIALIGTKLDYIVENRNPKEPIVKNKIMLLQGLVRFTQVAGKVPSEEERTMLLEILDGECVIGDDAHHPDRQLPPQYEKEQIQHLLRAEAYDVPTVRNFIYCHYSGLIEMFTQPRSSNIATTPH